MDKGKMTISIALAGNPNCGKTTIFNALTGLCQHVGNYPGVTVEKKEGVSCSGEYSLNITDLPGTYSLSPYSPDEKVARGHLVNDRPDLIINVLDITTLSRSLYLTTQLVELEIPMVLCLNKMDLAEKKGIRMDTELFSRLAGCPVITTVGTKDKGIPGLIDAAVRVFESGKRRCPNRINYGPELSGALSKLVRFLKKEKDIGFPVSVRYTALKLLEDDPEENLRVQGSGPSAALFPWIRKTRKRLSALFKEEPGERIADYRYGYIHGLLKESVNQPVEDRPDTTDRLDKILTHRVFGLPIFGLIMWLTFWLTFTAAAEPVRWIENGFTYLSGLLERVLPEGLMLSLLTEGVLGGVGGVVSFLPNILILFAVMAFLEDSGYLARVAFIMDRTMHRFGLHGKASIPLLLGFGCTVPAYMATRILENPRDRIITMHINTFMSCGARLPVIVLFCGAFWPGRAAGTVMFSIYALGILAALGSARLLAATRYRGPSEPFVMELPPYHLPPLKSILLHMWERSWLFLKKAGTVILAASVAMWILMNFPAEPGPQKTGNAPVKTGNALEYSIAGRIGKFIEPAIKPLGMDWKLGIGLVAGIAGKEIIVSTLATALKAQDESPEDRGFREVLRSDPAYSPLSAYSFLVFVLLYIPCLAALAVFKRESGSWKETFFQAGYTLGAAYAVSLLIYQAGRLTGFG